MTLRLESSKVLSKLLPLLLLSLGKVVIPPNVGFLEPCPSETDACHPMYQTLYVWAEALFGLERSCPN